MKYYHSYTHEIPWKTPCLGFVVLPGESWALLCSSALLVKNDAEDFVAILGGVSGATPNQFGWFGWGLTQRNCDLPNANNGIIQLV